jgi:hypothetical protein
MDIELSIQCWGNTFDLTEIYPHWRDRVEFLPLIRRAFRPIAGEVASDLVR